jgi:hypothetical protein
VTIQANIQASSAQTVNWLLSYPSVADNYGTTTQIAYGTWSVTTTATTFTATITGLPSGAVNGLQLVIQPGGGGAFTSGTLNITGVQLEKGTIATSFDYRPYGTELSLCQRYAYVPDANTYLGLSNSAYFLNSGFIDFPVSMRSAPSVSNGTFSASTGSSGTVGTTGTITTKRAGLYNSAGNWSTGATIAISSVIFSSEL